MVARRILWCVSTWACSFALFPCVTAQGGEADHPNQLTQPDQAMGNMVDSLFEFDNSNNRRPVPQPRVRRRRFASRHSSLQGQLVENPDQSDGTPAYALLDRYGGVLRYVEPVNHIDLSGYVGQTVGVRRDTGDTLLASQLALSGSPSRRAAVGGVQQVNFEEVISPGEIVEGPIVMHGGPDPVYMPGGYGPGGHEPVYLDDGMNFGGCPDCGSYVGCGSYVACGSRCRWGRRRCHGGYFGYELTILRPYISGAISIPGNYPATFDDAHGFGHRFILGYDGGEGLGARIRYWFYNHGHEFAIPSPAVPYNSKIGIDMDVADIEFTLDERLRNWELILAGGFRYGRLGLRENQLTNGSQLYFEGGGPTVAIEAIRPCGRNGFYLVGNFRASLLIGNWNNYTMLGEMYDDGIGSYKIKDENFTVLENQLGVGYTRILPRASLTLRTLWETQFWLNDTLADTTTGFGSNVAFAGPTATAELRF